MTLDFGSKNRFWTFSQPPRPSSSIVNRPGRSGNFVQAKGSPGRKGCRQGVTNGGGQWDRVFVPDAVGGEMLLDAIQERRGIGILQLKILQDFVDARSRF